MSKRFFKYFLDVPTFMPEPSLLHTGPGSYGQGLSVHHWTEISISIPKIVTEIRTLNVLRRIVTVITVLLPVGSRMPGRPSHFSALLLKGGTVRSR